MANKTFYLLLLSITLAFSHCSSRKTELKWESNLPLIGSQSSFRASDLNKDGVLDLVIGAGRNEFQHTDHGVLAFDGNNGELLWHHETHDQVFGSATFLDVTNDGIDDVFIGGRSANLKAIDGSNGSLIWKYETSYEEDSILKNVRFNFYNSILIPDQNDDGLQDLLTVNGGNSKAPANSTNDRYPGVLVIFNASNGVVIAADTMPDGKETYMTPLCFTQKDSDEHIIVFGTGGETISGDLYRISLEEFLTSGTKAAVKIATEAGHGFIAPPTAVDLTSDGILDIVAISHGSTIFAIDGATNKVVWKRKIDDTESSNSFSVGYFNKDDVPDLFTFVSRGQWPDNRGSLQVMLNGKTGTIEFIDSIGCSGFSSPVVYDLNRDGIDDAIISVNDYDCSQGFIKSVSETIINKLVSIDLRKHNINIIDEAAMFKNIFTTPWIGDLDNDNYLDIVYAQYLSESTFITTFLGMRVRRISTSIRMKRPELWGAYMGSNGDGVFPIRE